MQRFVAEQNIQRFKAMLARETSEDQRALLQRMIEVEQARLADPSFGAPAVDPNGPAQD
jgi:hypothetical protein